MRIKIVLLIYCFIICISCSDNDNTNNNFSNLQEYIDLNSTQDLGEVIACAASDKKEENTTYVFYYPVIGATDIHYFETLNASVDSNNFSNYILTELTNEPVFNGKLSRFIKESNKETWCIVTFKLDEKLYKSNPIRIKNVTKPTEWTNDVKIDFNEELKPKFSWNDGSINENIIYFEVITDNQNNFLSGTYTYEKCFQYLNFANVVLDINTSTLPSLIQDNIYNFTMMGVSEDNWVNLVLEKQFTAQ